MPNNYNFYNYTVYADYESTKGNTVVPVIYALLPGEQKCTFELLFNIIKNWSEGWNPEEIKLDFVSASLSALDKLFPSAHLPGLPLLTNVYGESYRIYDWLQNINLR